VKVKEEPTPVPPPVEVKFEVAVAEPVSEEAPSHYEIETPLSTDVSIGVPVASTSGDTMDLDPVVGHTPRGTTMAAADTSSEVAKRLKENFKAQISNNVIKYLGPYRKTDCKVGKITNNEDFKHLARKLTHAVMEKELKHCNRVEDLRVTESVLHKARDYVKKYMTKIGSEYKRTNASP